MKSVLVIDDNPTHRLINRKWLELLRPGLFRVTEAENAAEGVARIAGDSPDCVLLDFIMQGDDGFQTLHQLRTLVGCPPVIFLTCALTPELKRNALALGAYACFDKSAVTGEELVDAVAAATGVGT